MYNQKRNLRYLFVDTRSKPVGHVAMCLVWQSVLLNTAVGTIGEWLNLLDSEKGGVSVFLK